MQGKRCRSTKTTDSLPCGGAILVFIRKVGMRDEAAKKAFQNAILLLLTLAATAGLHHRATAATVSEICGLDGSYQALIVRVESQSKSSPGPIVEREGSQPHPAKEYCYLSAGDKLVVPPGYMVTVELADGQTQVVTSAQPLKVLEERPRNIVFMLIADLIGSDGKKAWEMAHSKIGLVRSDMDPIIVPGLLGLGEQNLTSAAPLQLRWDGGHAPFTVTLSAAAGNSPPLLAISSENRSASLDLSAIPPGSYFLAIMGVDGGPIPLKVRIVMPDAVPRASVLQQPLDRDSQALYDAVWLLIKGGPQWRLFAISRLNSLAKNKNPIAISIVGDQGVFGQK